MTTQNTADQGTPGEQDTSELPTVEITFRGRTLLVTFPAPEKLLVWQRTLQRLQTDNVKDWNGQQALAALDRIRKVVDSLLVHPGDIDWLDDEMLAGRLKMPELNELVHSVVDAFKAKQAEGANRAGRRAAAKTTTTASPARRKAPAKKAAPAKASSRKRT